MSDITPLVQYQMYANNATTTLAVDISATDTSIHVVQDAGAKFPANAENGFFLVTLEALGVVEILKVTDVTGDILTVERGWEGTTPAEFSAGAKVQMRVTAGTYANYLNRYQSLVAVDDLSKVPQASVMANSSFVSGTTDDYQNPIIGFNTEDGLWSFATHQYPCFNTIVTVATDTSVTGGPKPSWLTYAAGRYLIQFTSGDLKGVCREITGISGSTFSWNTPLPGGVNAEDQFSIYASNASRLSTLDTNSQLISAGQYGIGGSAALWPSGSFNDLTVATGFYYTEGDVTDGPATGVPQGIWQESILNGQFVRQIAWVPGTKKSYSRFGDSSSWSTWTEVGAGSGGGTGGSGGSGGAYYLGQYVTSSNPDGLPEGFIKPGKIYPSNDYPELRDSNLYNLQSSSATGKYWEYIPATSNMFQGGSAGIFDMDSISRLTYAYSERIIAVGQAPNPLGGISGWYTYSDDDGRSWTNPFYFADASSFYKVRVVGYTSGSPELTKWIAAGPNKSSWAISTDNGDSWSSMSSTDVPVDVMTDMDSAYTPDNHLHFIVVGQNAGVGAIYRQVEGGTWTDVTPVDFMTSSGYRIKSCNSTGVWMLSVFADTDATPKLYRSADHGVTWTALSEYPFYILSNSGQKIYQEITSIACHTDGDLWWASSQNSSGLGYWESRDNGQTWTHKSLVYKGRSLDNWVISQMTCSGITLVVNAFDNNDDEETPRLFYLDFSTGWEPVWETYGSPASMGRTLIPHTNESGWNGVVSAFIDPTTSGFGVAGAINPPSHASEGAWVCPVFPDVPDVWTRMASKDIIVAGSTGPTPIPYSLIYGVIVDESNGSFVDASSVPGTLDASLDPNGTIYLVYTSPSTGSPSFNAPGFPSLNAPGFKLDLTQEVNVRVTVSDFENNSTTGNEAKGYVQTMPFAEGPMSNNAQYTSFSSVPFEWTGKMNSTQNTLTVGAWDVTNSVTSVIFKTEVQLADGTWAPFQSATQEGADSGGGTSGPLEVVPTKGMVLTQSQVGKFLIPSGRNVTWTLPTESESSITDQFAEFQGANNGGRLVIEGDYSTVTINGSTDPFFMYGHESFRLKRIAPAEWILTYSEREDSMLLYSGGTLNMSEVMGRSQVFSIESSSVYLNFNMGDTASNIRHYGTRVYFSDVTTVGLLTGWSSGFFTGSVDGVHYEREDFEALVLTSNGEGLSYIDVAVADSNWVALTTHGFQAYQDTRDHTNETSDPYIDAGVTVDNNLSIRRIGTRHFVNGYMEITSGSNTSAVVGTQTYEIGKLPTPGLEDGIYVSCTRVPVPTVGVDPDRGTMALIPVYISRGGVAYIKGSDVAAGMRYYFSLDYDSGQGQMYIPV